MIRLLMEPPSRTSQIKRNILMATIYEETKTFEHITAALRPYPTKLFVETTTRCNLSCFMCVKQSDDRCIDEGDISEDTFARILPALHHAKALILNGVGEPLLHPKLELFISEAKKHMAPDGWIGFQSNGLLLDESRAFSLLEAGLDRICLSIDTINPEIFKKMRAGGELSSIEWALDHLDAVKTSLGKTNFRIGVEFVVMRSNLKELPAAIHWAASRGASFALVTHVLPYSEEHTQEAAYSLCSDQSLKFYLNSKEQAEREGVDISRYPQVIWKFNKSPEDRKIIQHVEKMKSDSEKSGVFLDLKKLYSLDLNWLEQVSAIFEEAGDIASQHDLDLHLPAIALRDNRKCDFVEEGSVFVSWNGEVHPCYFLWHAYQCFASGWRQQVQPITFGNLSDTNIMDIWNSTNFSNFRKSVSTYDYPYCSGCGLAPCDYVQTEDFQQDCHINEEPCGSCLWCMGIFQCLR